MSDGKAFRVEGRGESQVTWVPQVGSRTKAFLDQKTRQNPLLSEDVLESVKDEARQILSYSVAPEGPADDRAVLVVGYVQSGKTLSFTTVSALARDNGYGVIVLIAGTTKDLKGQSEERLEEDLGLGSLQRDWRHFDNPTPDVGSDASDMARTLENWKRHRSGETSSDKPALLLTVLKQHLRLTNLATILRDLEIDDVPALVIDDESDQASLNTQARKNVLENLDETSGTYQAIKEVREALPLHGYLQYTATPQANLLIAATDILNPGFVKVISPGPGYTGGQFFFIDHVDQLVRTIPDSDIFNPKDPFEEPPQSLQEAVKFFLLGLAAGAGTEALANRSMMVQPHGNTIPHKLYESWVTEMLRAWGTATQSSDPSVQTDVEADFTAAHADLASTVPNLPDLKTLLKRIPEIANEVRVVIVNSTPDALKKIKWKSWANWILIGGLKLDRGFTVEGLTVTYMPRRVTENADVLQQRARFFGYRESYSTFCRIYLPKPTKDAFKGYVADELHLRDSLKSHEGLPMRSWKRNFILHQQLTRPTRLSVIGRRAKRIPLDGGWTWPKSMHSGSDSISKNSELFSAFSDWLDVNYETSELAETVDKRSGTAPNLVYSGIDLQSIIEFLDEVRFGTVEDSLLATAVGLALGRRIKAEGTAETGTVVLMTSLDAPRGSGRSLSVLRRNIQVGQSPSTATELADMTYSGDRSFAATSGLTLHLRKIVLKEDPGVAVPWLAYKLPKPIANDAWLEYE